MQTTALNTIKNHNLITKGNKIIVGVSGGADSMALLSFLVNIRHTFSLSLIVVHVNHMLRGQESDDDARFVHRYCYINKIPFELITKDIALMSKRESLSTEDAGRIVRYKAFYNALEKHNADKIAVAHTINDQAETLLLHLVRGAGLKGMGAMQVLRDQIIRPLIECSRDQTEDYCLKNGIDYRTDSTNSQVVYARNNVRLGLIPYLKKEFNPNIISTLSVTASILRDDNDFMEETIKDLYPKIAYKDNKGAVMIETEILLAMHTAIRKRIVRDAFKDVSGTLMNLAYKHVESIMALCAKQSGKSVNLPHLILARINGNYLVMGKDFKEQTQEFAYELSIGEFVYIAELELYVSVNDSFLNERFGFIETSRTRLNQAKITGNSLIARNRLPGDRIAYKKTGEKKKLKDFLMEKKIPKESRNNILLIADEKEVIWIVPYMESQTHKSESDATQSLCVQVWKNNTSTLN